MIKLVITDLDNTIYNWVDFYVPSFNAMVMELSRLTGIDGNVLKESFKRVHQNHKTTEYAFSIQELDVLAEVNAGLTVPEILKKYHSAIKAFHVERKKTLHLYGGVKETLEKLRSEGKKIVGHTDASIFYALPRIKELGLEQLFDGLVALCDHGIPDGMSLEDVHYYNNTERYETTILFKKEIEHSIMKPNPECLTEILQYFNAKPNEAVYVGDSLYRDIFMAQKCGIYDVFAEYGRQYNPKHYRQLVEITHWRKEDVANELELKKLNIYPSFSISRFEELMDVIKDIDRNSERSNGHQEKVLNVHSTCTK